jgi:molybdate transport system ATP-binding protein
MEVLKADEITVKLYGNVILSKISFTVQKNEQWAIVGPSGSGKTALLKALAGKQFFTGQLTFAEENARSKIILVEQQHHFKTLSNTSNFYYQQRFNSQDAEDTITVEEDLQQVALKNTDLVQQINELANLFDIKKLFPERLIQLSNGENKRLQIIKALMLRPAFLLLDNPFIGLDVKSRNNLENVLNEVAQRGVSIVLVTGAAHLPFFITNVLSLSDNGVGVPQSVKPEQWNKTHQKTGAKFSFNHKLLSQLNTDKEDVTFAFAVKMKNVNIEYDRKILDNISWEVRKGERWSLSGPNGSGKSTLLSLVNADNPQAYANDIYLFDKKRGTGETIWNIKKKTGFISPELHLYFEKGINSFEVIASGLFDTIGLFRQVNEQQSQLVKKWMQLLKIEHLERKFLHQLSNSEQRLVLLARALVKNPLLLILDEPCQGLDEEQINVFKEIINQICVTGNKTLIYVSHYEHEIPECVTKFIRLEEGRRIK